MKHVSLSRMFSCVLTATSESCLTSSIKSSGFLAIAEVLVSMPSSLTHILVTSY